MNENQKPIIEQALDILHYEKLKKATYDNIFEEAKLDETVEKELKELQTFSKQFKNDYYKREREFGSLGFPASKPCVGRALKSSIPGQVFDVHLDRVPLVASPLRQQRHSRSIGPVQSVAAPSNESFNWHDIVFVDGAFDIVDEEDASDNSVHTATAADLSFYQNTFALNPVPVAKVIEKKSSYKPKNVFKVKTPPDVTDDCVLCYNPKSGKLLKCGGCLQEVHWKCMADHLVYKCPFCRVKFN